MIQDKGSKTNLGFGIEPVDVERPQQGPNPSNGAVARALEGKPVTSFVVAALASVTSLFVAGKIAKSGGYRLGEVAADLARQEGWLGQQIKQGSIAVRKAQSYLDELEGVTRQTVDPEDWSVFAKRDANGDWIKESVQPFDSAKMRAVAIDNGRDVPAWQLRDSIQQRLASQAKRLPYELPGAYLIDKAVVNPLLGHEPRRDVNWSNPADVLGDFAWESMKTLGLGVLPFEVAGAGGGQAYRNFSRAFNTPGGGQENNLGIMTTKAILEQVGIKSGNLINKTVRYSNQSMGAFSSAVQEASEQRGSIFDVAKRASSIIKTNNSAARSAGSARRRHSSIDALRRDPEFRNQLFDAMPGPFRGMNTGVTKFNKTRKEIGQTYDDWQDLIGGKLDLGDLDSGRQERVKNFMNKGGASYLEEAAVQMNRLGIAGVRGADDIASGNVKSGVGQLDNMMRRSHYKETLVQKMMGTMGLSEQDALKFVRFASKIDPPSQQNTNATSMLANRIQFKKGVSHTSADDVWWEEVQSTASNFNIGLKGSSLDDFRQVIALTDQAYQSKGSQAILNARIGKTKASLGELLPDEIGKSIASRKIEYNDLKLSLGNNESFLVRNTAATMGIRVQGDDGAALSLNALKNQIINKGIDANDQTRLLGYLVEKKKVKAPWERKGNRNIFGFSALSVDEAFTNGYFANADEGAQLQIKNIVERRAKAVSGLPNSEGAAAASAAQSALKLKGVYRTASGSIIDIGRIKRGIIGGTDAFASETQVPILGFNPLEVGFYKVFKAGRSVAPIQFADKYSLQNATQRLGKGAAAPDSGYMYLRKGNKSKGNLYGLNSSAIGQDASITKFAGEFKPFIGNRATMTGRYAEQLLGESSVPRSDTQTGWRKLFNVSTEQESNLFMGKNSLVGRVISAARDRPDAIRNPKRASRLFGSSDFEPNRLTPLQSEAFENMFEEVSGQGPLKKGFRRFVQSNLVDGSINPYDKSALTIRSFLDSDLDMPMSVENKDFIRGAQGRLKKLYDQSDKQSNFWNLPAPPEIRTSGVATRLDQIRSEFSNYLLLREGVATNNPASFATRVSDMMLEVDDMYMKGAMSRVERAESRAAILSLQLDYSRVQAYSPLGDQNRLLLNRDTLNDALSGSPKVRELFEDYGNYQSESSGLFGAAKARVKRKLAPASYSGPDQVDPFSGAGYTFVPTVASSFRNNPVKTVMGLAGASGSVDSVSTGSLFAVHMAARTNKFFEGVGLGLDPLAYKNPMDLFARGIVGKRVLPAYAVGTTAMALDRTAGGMVYKDEEGNRVYRPLVLGAAAKGVAEGQIALAGITPGGQSGAEKRAEVYEGEVPVRQGRYWLLNSNTPFKGGRIEYFRPSWYQRMTAAGEYAPEMKQTPLEKLAFGYDFSPLRPLDPYRQERQSASTRPYPLTGDYFTGPFGPVTSVLNATVGRVLKPSLKMNEEATALSLASYAPLGEGAAASVTGMQQSQRSMNASYSALASGGPAGSSQALYGAMGYSQPRGMASSATRQVATNLAKNYEGAATGQQYAGMFAPMLATGLGGSGVSYGGQVVPSSAVQRGTENRLRAGRLGFESQEMAGIYGFGFGAVRQGLGIGTQDYTPQTAVLDKASRGYSSSRSFWGLNLGGMGDAPLPIEGRYANLEFSEVIRRFVPKDQQGIQYINGIPNELGQLYPWLPGPGSFNNYKAGDPYAKLDNSIRLPGTARNRIVQRYPDMPGQEYGITDIHDMLGDLDPFGDNYRQINRQVDSQNLSEMQRAKIAQTRAQVAAMGIRNEFSPYEYKYDNTLDSIDKTTKKPLEYTANRIFENLAHRDTFLNAKFLRVRTATEDWERDNVYGATYPSWNTPIDSFIQPMMNKASQRDPMAAATSTAAIGYLFGASARAKTAGSLIGGIAGLGSSMYGNAYEAITGKRYIPSSRRKELMLEEQVDILSYTHAMVNASRALESGDRAGASYFLDQSTKTMYGANLNATPEQMAMAVPKRKREHFKAMMYAPEQEREQILSTAGRLERRMLQAAWGQQVEQLPGLGEYFQERELPGPNSGFWSPYTDMDNIKIKMGQSLGLDLSQMGYYPQQIQEANLVNPAYPAVFSQNSSRSVNAQLSALLNNMGVQATIEQRPSMFSSGDQYELIAGV